MILILAATAWLAALLIALARAQKGEIPSVTLSEAKGLSMWRNGILRFAQNDMVRDVLAIGGIGAATAGFFWRLLAGQVWMPAGGGDLAQFLYPTYTFAAESWRRGVIPLWNPYLFAGAPFVGDIQSGIFYPLNLLTFLISSPLTFCDMEYLSVLHFFIAGAGMFAFLRYGKLRTPALACGASVANYESPTSNFQSLTSNFQLSRPAALGGAIAFEFSDLFITHFGNLNLIAVVSWLPLVLLFYSRAVTDRRPAFAAIAGLVLAVAFLAGHVQSFLFILVALMLWALFYVLVNRGRAVEQIKNRQSKIENSRLYPFVLLTLVALVAFGLSAPALLPSIEMTQHTVRAVFSYEQAAQFSLPPAQLIGLFIPGFFGRGPQNVWGPWPRVEVGYIGVLPLVLALLALILRRDAITRFFGVLALIGLALALGGYTILHGWLYQFVPGFGQLRAPARFIVLTDVALAVLAAFGFDMLLHALPHASERVFRRIVRAAPWAFLLIALAAGSTAYAILILGQGQDAVLFNRIANAANALAFFILLLALSIALIVARGTRFFRRGAWAALALALIFFDLFSLGAYVDASTDDPTHVFEHPDAVAFLKSDGSFYRVDPRETGVDNVWPPDTSILYGIFDVNGDNPLVLADFDRYWQSLGSRSTPPYDLLNAKYLIGRKNVPLDRAKFRLAFDGDPGFSVFENTRVLPRAFIVYDVRVVPDHAAALAAIHTPDFDPVRMVVLETADRRPPTTEILRSAQNDSAAVSSQPSVVEIVGYGPNEILLDVNTPSAGVLVLSEAYYPGWRAWEDNREVEVMRANYLFRAVELPAGTHRVRLLYDPAWFKIGVGLFAVTMLALIGWFGWWRWRK
jgi:hypothetical protein